MSKKHFGPKVLPQTPSVLMCIKCMNVQESNALLQR
jgi:hypothetical protein